MTATRRDVDFQIDEGQPYNAKGHGESFFH